MRHTLITLALGSALFGCSPSNPEQQQTTAEPQAQSGVEVWPKLNVAVKPSDEVEAQVAAILATMTLEQKIAQMIQPEIRNISVEDMRKYGFGSYLNGGGAFPNDNKHATVADWVTLADNLYQASIDDSLDGSSIPTMWGTDAVHGHNNVIGATIFPHNIGLGAANNPDLIERIATITAKEVLATGIDWVFAPTVATVRDDRWGRTYESYSEDPAIVKAYSAAIVNGLQGRADGDFLAEHRVISTVKHFVGDGGTVGGDDQGNNIDSEVDLFNIHAQGYVGGLEAGSQSVMASFNSWHGEKIHGSKYLLTDVLKERMGFDGFVVGDWNGHGQVKGCTNQSCAQAVNAGVDIIMVPSDWKAMYENTLAQVKSGEISQARIDDAVTRILRVKVRAGLFDAKTPKARPYAADNSLIGHPDHRDVAKQAVRESLVLLKNKANTLPLAPNSKVLVAGDAAHNIGKQSGGWTITWQGTNNTNADFPNGSSIYDGINDAVTAAGGKAVLSVDGSYDEKPDVAIVVFGEEPYAEGHGDRDTLEYQRGSKQDLALLRKLKADGIPVVSVFISGRPMWVNAELNASDAFVAAWLPGSEGGAISDVLFTDQNGDIQHDFTGRLSFSWPKTPKQIVNLGDEDYDPLLPYGFGLSYGDANVLGDELVETVETDAAKEQPVAILSGTVQAPWELWLYSGDDSQLVSASSHTLGALSYRTIDKVIQEDARLITLDGSQGAGIRFASKSYFREDLSALSGANPVLSFNYRLDAAPSKPVYLAMSCEGEGDASGSCYARQDISKQLVADGNWQNLSLDLSCFTQQGLMLNKMVVPFDLQSEGKLTLGIADIAITPRDEPMTPTCE